MPEDSHLSDEELLRTADGEFPPRHVARARSHLNSCWHCRARMAALENTITDFTNAFQNADPALPPVEGPRAALKARMAEVSEAPRVWSWPTFRVATGAFAVLALAFAAMTLVKFKQRTYFSRATPSFALTPGAIRFVTRDQVCSPVAPERPPALPASLRQAVFQEYGMSSAKADAFEVDYLVTPELGGANDIRNLWPEPYASTAWNAHVKDALEDRLHEMVCSGDIDLATAQHDIASDWISAYKKYFHTNKP